MEMTRKKESKKERERERTKEKTHTKKLRAIANGYE